MRHINVCEDCELSEAWKQEVLYGYIWCTSPVPRGGVFPDQTLDLGLALTFGPSWIPCSPSWKLWDCLELTYKYIIWPHPRCRLIKPSLKELQLSRLNKPYWLASVSAAYWSSRPVLRHACVDLYIIQRKSAWPAITHAASRFYHGRTKACNLVRIPLPSWSVPWPLKYMPRICLSERLQKAAANYQNFHKFPLTADWMCSG